ncbi:hypothetical protein ABZ054_22185, partial [Streptomyces sp. NPDC006324]
PAGMRARTPSMMRIRLAWEGTLKAAGQEAAFTGRDAHGAFAWVVVPVSGADGLPAARTTAAGLLAAIKRDLAEAAGL